MRFARIVAAGAGLAVLGGAGLAAAPVLLGAGPAQEEPAPKVKVSPRVRTVIVDDKDGEVEILRAGGSRLGVSVRDVEQADVTRQKLPAAAGAVVEDVSENSAAAKAGVKEGDVIVAFDGERVRSARQLERLVEETPAGRTVKLALHRDGTRSEVDITPEAPKVSFFSGRPMRWQMVPEFDGELLERTLPRVERDLRRRLPAMEFEFDGGGFGLVAGRGRLGVRVQDLSPELAAYFGVKSGVLVAGVDDDSPAAKAGIKAGDVITGVNGQNISDPGDLRREVARVKEGETAELSVTRDKKPLSLKVEPESRSRTVERRVRRMI